MPNHSQPEPQPGPVIKPVLAPILVNLNALHEHFDAYVTANCQLQSKHCSLIKQYIYIYIYIYI